MIPQNFGENFVVLVRAVVVFSYLCRLNQDLQDDRIFLIFPSAFQVGGFEYLSHQVRRSAFVQWLKIAPVAEALEATSCKSKKSCKS